MPLFCEGKGTFWFTWSSSKQDFIPVARGHKLHLLQADCEKHVCDMKPGDV